MKLKSSDNSFFGGDKEQDNDTYSSTPKTASPATEKVQNIQTQPKSRSVIGSNIKFRGELIGTEDLHIEGTIEGTIIMKGHNLSIGNEGAIDANVHANNITIDGKLTGDVLADELIAIKKSAVVKGNLIAPRIQLDDGGKFRGSMDMVDNEQEKKASTDAFAEKLVHPHLPPRKSGQSTSPSVSAKNDSVKASSDKSKNEKN